MMLFLYFCQILAFVVYIELLSSRGNSLLLPSLSHMEPKGPAWPKTLIFLLKAILIQESKILADKSN